MYTHVLEIDTIYLDERWYVSLHLGTCLKCQICSYPNEDDLIYTVFDYLVGISWPQQKFMRHQG